MTGPELLKLRRSLELTQVEFADAVLGGEVHSNTISRWERKESRIMAPEATWIRLKVAEYQATHPPAPAPASKPKGQPTRRRR